MKQNRIREKPCFPIQATKCFLRKMFEIISYIPMALKKSNNIYISSEKKKFPVSKLPKVSKNNFFLKNTEN